jgi:pimeloyl-ACP methyl ester carboxylesterase
MACFVLVAGAFHGAWAWKAVAASLADRGHDVHRLDLTGQGARIHSAGPETTLETHIEDVVAYVLIEELCDIVLVGHSYAGMVVTGAADRLGDRTAHVVYLDALVPQDGQCAADISGAAMADAATAAAAGHWATPFFLPIEKFGPFRDDAQRDWLISKLRPHPLRTFFDRIDLQGSPPAKRTLVYCSLDPLGIFDVAAENAKTSADWGYRELSTGHDPMITAPDQVVDLLEDILTSGNG